MTYTPGVKIALVGPGGSGKSTLAALLAIGLCKSRALRSHAVLFDATGHGEYLRDLFAIEDVELRIVRATSFVDLRAAFDLAEADERCAVFLCDPYAAPRVELVEALKLALGLKGRRLAFHQRDELLAVWESWVRAMSASRLHCLFTGPGVMTADREDLDGTDDRALGGADADSWHEANLIIELRAEHARDRHVRRSRPVYSAYVMKDRTRRLTGRRFAFRGSTLTKAGQYKRVLNAFAPHILDAARPTWPTTEALGERSSAALFVGALGESPYELERRRAKIAVESIHATIGILWPGKDQNSVAIRTAVQQEIFSSRSWTEIEGRRAGELEACLEHLQLIEQAIRAGASIAAPGDVARVLADIDNAPTPAAARDVQ